jgi:hypothetical protein
MQRGYLLKDKMKWVAIIILASFFLVFTLNLVQATPEITVVNGTTNLSAEFTNVTLSQAVTNASRAFVYHTVRLGAASSPDKDWVRASLTNTTTLWFHKNNSATNTLVEWQVIESPNFTVQRGSSPNLTTGQTYTQIINAVNLSRSFLVFSYDQSDTNTNRDARAYWNGTFANSTAIVFSRNLSTATYSRIDWQVIDWAGATVQTGYVTQNAVATATATINAVNLSNSFIISSSTSNAVTPDAMFPQVFFKNTTTVNVTRKTGTTFLLTTFFVISHPSIIVQNGSNSFTATAQQNATLTTPINLSTSFAVMSYSTNATLVAFNTAKTTVQLHNTTAIALKKDNATNQVNTNWFAISDGVGGGGGSPANCWTYDSVGKMLIIPTGCMYSLSSGGMQGI